MDPEIILDGAQTNKIVEWLKIYSIYCLFFI